MQFLTSVALTSPTGAVDRVAELGDAQHEHDHLHRNLKGFDLELCADYDVPHVRVLDVTGAVLAQVPVTQVVSFLEGELKHVEAKRLAAIVKAKCWCCSRTMNTPDQKGIIFRCEDCPPPDLQHDLCERCGKPFGEAGPPKSNGSVASRYCQTCVPIDRSTGDGWTLAPPRTPEELKLLADAGAAQFATIVKAASPADVLQAAQDGLATGDLSAPEAKALLDASAPPAPAEAVASKQPKLSRAERRAQRKASKGA